MDAMDDTFDAVELDECAWLPSNAKRNRRYKSWQEYMEGETKVYKGYLRHYRDDADAEVDQLNGTTELRDTRQIYDHSED